MSDFILDGDDYINLLNTEEDFKKFNRMKEIWESGELNKSAKECFNVVIEFDNLRQDLHGEKRHKFLIIGDPKLN
jgi:hypothetical protein